MSVRATQKEEQFTWRTANWLKQLRLNKKISQAEMGEMIGVHRNTMARYEAGAAIPLYVFLRICEKFEVGPEEVLKW